MLSFFHLILNNIVVPGYHLLIMNAIDVTYLITLIITQRHRELWPNNVGRHVSCIMH